MESIDETITRQQTAINSIQATLAAQQNDIVAIKTTITDIRISINNIIHSVSEIATKLGFQIALPPPLPLSSAPLIPLPATVTGSPTAAPSSLTPALTKVSSLAISPFPPSSDVTYSLQSLHQTTLAHPIPTDNITSFPKTKVVAPTIANEDLSDNNIDISFSILTNDNVANTRPSLFPFLFTTNLMAALSSPHIFPYISHLLHRVHQLHPLVECKKKMCESKPLIFDPGGKIKFECLFVVRFIHGDAKLNHNSNSITLMPRPPTSDLEDKVVFEESVMIRYCMTSNPPDINTSNMKPAKENIAVQEIVTMILQLEGTT